jgi:hypothetical protein
MNVVVGLLQIMQMSSLVFGHDVLPLVERVLHFLFLLCQEVSFRLPDLLVFLLKRHTHLLGILLFALLNVGKVFLKPQLPLPMRLKQRHMLIEFGTDLFLYLATVSLLC